MYNSSQFGLKPKHRGFLNRDKTIYFMNIGNSDCGFFAVYRLTLELLYMADVCGMVPVVQYNKSFLYAEGRKMNGSNNPFEYYFRQPAISITEARNSFRVVSALRLHSDMVELVLNGRYGEYGASGLYLRQMAKMQKKYISLKPEVKGYIDGSIRESIGDGNILGVHIRGTDFKKNYHIHPKCIPVSKYIDEIRKEVNTGKWDKVFLATDDRHILMECEKEFGNKIIFYKDVYRGEKECSVAFSEDARPFHKYMLGLEVLRDAYTLAYCNGLIAGISQVSICARIIKLSNNANYKFLKILDEGYNSNGRSFKRRTGSSEKRICERMGDKIKKGRR